MRDTVVYPLQNKMYFICLQLAFIVKYFYLVFALVYVFLRTPLYTPTVKS